MAHLLNQVQLVCVQLEDEKVTARKVSRFIVLHLNYLLKLHALFDHDAQLDMYMAVYPTRRRRREACVTCWRRGVWPRLCPRGGHSGRGRMSTAPLSPSSGKRRISCSRYAHLLFYLFWHIVSNSTKLLKCYDM